MATHSSILAWEIPWTESLAGYSPWGREASDTTVATQHARTVLKDNKRNRDVDENSIRSLKDRLQETMGADSRMSSYLARVFCGLSAKQPRRAIRRHSLLWCTQCGHPAARKEASQGQSHIQGGSQRNEPRTWQHQDPSSCTRTPPYLPAVPLCDLINSFCL